MTAAMELQGSQEKYDRTAYSKVCPSWKIVIYIAKRVNLGDLNSDWQNSNFQRSAKFALWRLSNEEQIDLQYTVHVFCETFPIVL